MNQNNDELKTIHTFQSDAAEALTREHVSQSQIFVAEQQKKQSILKKNPSRSSTTSNFGTNIRYLGVILLFLCIAGGGIYYFIFYKPNQTVVVIVPEKSTVPEESILTFDTLTHVSLPEPINQTSLVSAIQKEKETYNSPQTKVVTFDLTGDKFISIIDPQLPGNFIRSIDPTYAFGFSTSTFIILNVNSYDIARGTLLSSEDTLISNLKPFFNVTSTSSLQFEDKVVGNKDVRMLQDSNGSEYFLYSFIDNSTLVFAENSDTFISILDRIQAAKR